MPQRFRLLEQIAFVLTNTFALTCLAVVIWQMNPELVTEWEEASSLMHDVYAACPAHTPHCILDYQE